MLAVNSMPDHIHIFIGLKPDVSLSSLVRDIKANSSRWIHEQTPRPGSLNGNEDTGHFLMRTRRSLQL
jgi:REP element-mobilizing transposase RayT